MSSSKLVLNRFRLLRLLGQGGMGKVYLAQDLWAKAHGRAKCVALKFLPKRSLPQQIAAFKQEFSVFRNLQHPYLARVYDFGLDSERNQYFFTSEYLKGQDLSQATRRIGISQVLVLFTQICEALAYIHEKGVLHNDLKPSNVLVCHGQIKVLDFGLSSIGKFTHVAGGTVGYLAPEIVHGGPRTIRSDLFSLGKLLAKVLLEKRENTELRQNLEKCAQDLANPQPEKRPASVRQLLMNLRKTEVMLPQIPPFVGRQKIMHDILTSSKQPKRDGPLWIHIKGQKGVGKSRILQELRHEFQLTEIAHAFAHCGEEQKEAYAPWPQIFRQLEIFLLDTDDLAVRKMKDFFAPESSAVDSLPVSEESAFEYGAQRQLQFFYYFSQFLHQSCQIRKVFIIFDDLDCLNVDSLALWHFLLKSPIGNLVFISSSVSAAEQMSVEVTLPKPVEMNMKPFHVNETKEFLEGLFGLNLPVLFVSQAYRNTRGNVGEIHDILQSLLKRGEIKWQQNKWVFPRRFPKRRVFRKERPRPISTKARREQVLSAYQSAKEYLSQFCLRQAEQGLQLAYQNLSFFSKEDQRSLQRDLVDFYFFQGQVEKALPILERLIRGSEPGSLERISYELKTVILYRTQGSYRRALDLAQKVLPQVSKQKSEVLIARFLAQIAQCEARLEVTSNSLARLDEAIARVPEKVDAEYHGVLRNIRGSFYLEFLKKADKALEDFQKAEKIFQCLHIRRHQATIYHNLAIAYGLKGDAEKETLYCQKAIDVARQAGDVRRMLYILKTLGNSSFKRGHLRQAQQSYFESLAFSRLLSDRSQEAKNLLNLARVGQLHADYEKAISYYREAWEIIRHLENSAGYQTELLTEASLWVSLGRFDEAKKSIQKVLSLGKPKLSLHGVVLMFQGEIFSLQGNHERSRQVLANALRLLRKDKQESLCAQVRSLEIQDQLLSQKSMATGTIDILEEALAIFAAEDNQIALMSTQILLFKVMCAIPSMKSKAHDQAKRLQKLYPGLSAEFPEFAVDLDLCVARLCAKSGDFSAAISHLEQAQSLWLSIRKSLQSKNQEAYRNTLLAQHLFTEYEALRSKTHPLVQRWRHGQDELSQKEFFLSAQLSFLEKSYVLTDCADFLLKGFLSAWKSKRGVLFFKRSKDPLQSLSWDFDQRCAWNAPSSVLELAEKQFQKDSEPKKQTQSAKYLLQPLCAFGHMFGLVVAEAAVFSSSASFEPSLRENWVRFSSLLFFSVMERENLTKRKEQTLTSLSQIRSAFRLQHEKSGATRLGLGSIIGGKALSMASVLDCMEKIVSVPVTVLLEGEPGTGKSLFAENLHALSPLSTKPFVVVDAAESELSNRLHEGFDGVLYLKNVSEMSLKLQGILLQTLEKFKKLPCRLITSASRNLKEMMERREFRRDLFEHLNVITLYIPPLRDRREDIPSLIEYFLQSCASEMNSPKKRISEQAMRLLYYAYWPGNVGQLQQVIKELALRHPKNLINREDLPKDLGAIPKDFFDYNFEIAQKKFMQDYLTMLLQHTGGNIVQASRLSGTARSRFYKQMHLYLR